MTDAVANHHQPPAPGAPFDGVAVTYIANALIEEAESRPDADARVLDARFVEGGELDPHLQRWRDLAAAQCRGGGR